MDFSSEEEVKKALKCNREYMGKDAGTFIHSFIPSFIPLFLPLLHHVGLRVCSVSGTALGTGRQRQAEL